MLRRREECLEEGGGDGGKPKTRLIDYLKVIYNMRFMDVRKLAQDENLWRAITAQTLAYLGHNGGGGYDDYY